MQVSHDVDFKMPSTRKRIGFLPKVVVQNILQNICSEEKMSQSRLTGILVEEALYARGLLSDVNDSDSNKDKLYVDKLNRYCNRFDSPELKSKATYKKSSIESIENFKIFDSSYSNEELLLLNYFIEYRRFKRMLQDKEKNQS